MAESGKKKRKAAVTDVCPGALRQYKIVEVLNAPEAERGVPERSRGNSPNASLSC